MAKLEIVQVGSPVLHMPAASVSPDLFGSAALAQFVDSMKETMRAAPGVGLAAPQVGVPLRIIVLEDNPGMMIRLSEAEIAERERTEFAFKAIVNPVLRALSDEVKTFRESCLSVRGLVGAVEKHLSVEVTGVDVNGEELEPWRTRGWPARILQHEVDHLDGIIFFQRAIMGTLRPWPDVVQQTISDGAALERWLATERLTQIPG